MKLRSGVDLVEVERLQGVVRRYGERFLQRVYTPRELAEAGGSPASLAARFAAKEAASKALGSGIGRVGWQEIEVLRPAGNQPQLVLHGAASLMACEQGLTAWSLSLSHTGELAIALVVALGE
ncbi:MAG: holo-ACP synthase [Anaerolineales bacterium]|nr:holo-ACP synthase [Anaerolineales bacterium]